MGSYVGPATLEWSEGESRETRRLEVECRAESRRDASSDGELWEGELFDRIGLLAKVADSARRPVRLRTPSWSAEIRLTKPPPPPHASLASRDTYLFIGFGDPPF